MKRFQNVKEGDKVYCRINGNGVIVDIEKNTKMLYPISVQFNDCTEDYTLEGKLYDDHVEAILFYRDDTSDYLTERPFNPYENWKEDDKIYVTNDSCVYNSRKVTTKHAYKRYFAEIKEGRVYCFPDGTTSWSNVGIGLTQWDYAWKEGE